MFSKKAGKPDRLQGRRIGIFGLGRGIGTTHIAITLANYLSRMKHKRVSFIEDSGRQELMWLLTQVLGLECGSESYCEYNRVTYGSRLSFNSSCDCTVIDLGSNGGKLSNKLHYCDIKIAVGAAAPWRTEEYKYLDELRQSDSDISDWILLVNLCSYKRIREYNKYCMITGAFPLTENPLYPGVETAELFTKLFS